MVSTEKGGEKRERETGEKVSWSPNRQLPYHFQLDLVIPDGTQEQFSYDGFLNRQQLVVDSSTTIVELYSKGKRTYSQVWGTQKWCHLKLEKRKAYQQESERETERGQLDQEAYEHLPQPLGRPDACGESRLCWSLVSVGAVLTYSDVHARPRHFPMFWKSGMIPHELILWLFPQLQNASLG